MTESQFHKDYLSLAETLYRIAYYILESEEEARDAVQEVYLKLWETRAALDEIRAPKAYCIRMVKNICMDRIRRAGFLCYPKQLPDIESADTEEEAIDRKTRLNKVLEAIKALPERQRQVLILRTMGDLSYEEISDRMGINYLTCRVLLSQARSKIKSKI